MNLQGTTSFVLLPEQELDALKTTQLQILEGIKKLHSNSPKPVMANYITAVEFMAAVKSVGQSLINLYWATKLNH